jgi:V8-like Glu-specific endopeptidase
VAGQGASSSGQTGPTAGMMSLQTSGSAGGIGYATLLETLPVAGLTLDAMTLAATGVAYSTAAYPYNDVVLVQTVNPGNPPGYVTLGSGAIIGPHTILTASHVLWDAEHGTAATNVQVYAGYNGQYGATIPFGSGVGGAVGGGVAIHYFHVGNGDGTINASDGATDYAIIDVSATFSSWMPITTNYGGGQVHVTGYPVVSNGVQTDVTGTVTKNSGFALLNYSTALAGLIHPGNSGGPMWIDNNGSPSIVGVISSSAWAVQLTASDLQTINNWILSDSYLWSVADDYAASASTTGQIALNTSVTGAIETAGDHDWFRVQLNAGTAYVIDLRGADTGAGTLADPYLRLYNGAGQLLAQNDDAGGTHNSEIVYIPAVSGTYYIDAGAHADAASGTYRVSIAQNFPTVQWSASIELGSHMWAPAGSGDFNGDGTADLAWFDAATGGVDVWKVGGGQWAGSVRVGTHPPGATPAGVADFNNDGNADIAWFNSTNGHIEVWKLADGRWSGNIDFGPHPPGWQPVAAADFTHDGSADILWFSPSSGDVELWQLEDGHWAASIPVGPHPGSGWQPAGAADFDNDGYDDLLWSNAQTGGVEIWKLVNGHWAGNYSFGAHPAGAQVAGIGDFNNDGYQDILWVNPTTGYTEAWQLVGGHWAASIPVGTHPADWTTIAVQDFNHDGTADVVWRNPTTGQVDEWLLAHA